MFCASCLRILIKRNQAGMLYCDFCNTAQHATPEQIQAWMLKKMRDRTYDTEAEDRFVESEFRKKEKELERLLDKIT